MNGTQCCWIFPHAFILILYSVHYSLMAFQNNFHLGFIIHITESILKQMSNTYIYILLYKHYGMCMILNVEPIIYCMLQIRLGDLSHLARALLGNKSITLPSGTWSCEASRRLAVLCLTTIALLIVRLQIMGSQLPVFTR